MNTRDASLLIHATNVTGLGATRVAESLLEALCRRLQQKTLIFVPATGTLSAFSTSNPRVSVTRFPRRVPNALSRLVECVAPSLYFPQTDQTLVLGDIPLRGRTGQVVFVQQAHLISPSVDPHVGSSAVFRTSRFLASRHFVSVAAVVVQSEPMKESLVLSFPTAAGRVAVLPHPSPDRFEPLPDRSGGTGEKALRLVYPAANYPHKNHAILRAMDAAGLHTAAVLEEIAVTLTSTEAESLQDIAWIRTLGRTPAEEWQRAYASFDGLFFPSLLESYGLPLVEAMAMGLPIVCADLPYARWLCGGAAVYFDPLAAHDAWRAIGELKQRLDRGWHPDWREALAKLLPSWDATAEALVSIMNDAAPHRLRR